MDTASERKRFICRVAVVGAVVPFVLIAISLLTRSSQPPSSSVGETAFFVAYTFVWPTWIFFFDAEKPALIVYMWVFTLPIQAGWYVLLGFLVWKVRSSFRSARLHSRPS